MNPWSHRLPRLATMVGLPLLVAVGLLALYLRPGAPGQGNGAPGTPSPMAGVTTPHGSPAQVQASVERLAENLKVNPNDAVGWGVLGRSYTAIGRHADAADAFGRSVDLGAADSATFALLGEALVRANGGTVVPEARAAFRSALEADAREPRSRFFLGASRLQDGDARGAIAIWRDLERSAEPSAPWLPVVRQQILSVAAHAGIDAAEVPPSNPMTGIAREPAPSAPLFVPITPVGRRLTDFSKGE